MTTPPITIPSFEIPAIIVTLLIAALCGALAQLIVGYTRGGCLASMLVGIVGALIGSWLASWLRLPNILIFYGVDVVWTVIGAALLVSILAVIMGGSRYRGFRRGPG
jgi:uncharacterized membrane protein YeaQ/YmgE (transglycosylase-associated protein family)